MPELDLTGPELQALQRHLKDAGYEAPDADSWPSEDEYADEGGHIESYHHAVADERMLYRVLNACPVCGDPECDRGVAYVGANMIHRDKHPEVRAERARNRRGGRW